MDRRWKEREKEGGGRKSSIVAEGTGRPSVASTCCASRSHFTPLSFPNSVPSFFNFFYPFFKFVLSHTLKTTLRRLIRFHFLVFGFFSPISLISRNSRARARAQLLYTSLYCSGNEYAYYTVSPRCVLQSVPQRKLYIYFFIAF